MRTMDNSAAVYDLVFSLGQACACSLTLRQAGLQFASYPLDWVSGGTIVSRARLIATHFDGWLEPADFEYLGRNPKNGLGIYVNRRSGFRHPHDFPDKPLASSFDRVRKKYDRRVQRFFGHVARARRALAVYISRPDEPPTGNDDLAAARETLTNAFPGVLFDLVHFAFSPGVPFTARKVVPLSDGITQISFDYRDPIRDVMIEDTAQALVELGVVAKDWRSEDDRRAFADYKQKEDARRKREIKLRRKMEKYGVTTRIGLLCARLVEPFARLRRRFGRRTHDLAFGLGAACACSKCLRDAHLQFASFPFDWISGGTARVRAKLIAERFDGWLEKDDFVYGGHNTSNGLGIFTNRRTGFNHLHDFADAPLEESYETVVEKFHRREARLLRLLATARKVLVVCVDTTNPDGEPSSYVAPGELAEVRATLLRAFPHACFDIVHFAYAPGVPFASRQTDHPGEDVTEITFDYRDIATNVRFRDIVKVLLDDLRIAVRYYSASPSA